MAGGKINIYGLGTAGVNVVKSPIHLDDQELTKAQNAWPDRSSGQGSIRKRDGLVALNSLALDGAITGICPVPLPAPDVGGLGRLKRVYLATASSGGSLVWKTAIGDDAAVVAATAGLFSFDAPALIPTGGSQFFRNTISLNGRMYYPINSPTGGVLAYNSAIGVFDGEREFELCRVAAAEGTLVPVGVYNGQLLLRTDTRLLLADPDTGQTTDLYVATFTRTAFSWQNKVFVGEIGQVSIGSPTQAFTVDHTDVGVFASFASYNGNLYVGLSAGGTSAAKILQRTPAGAWTTSMTGDEAVLENQFTYITVHDGLLYAFYHVVNGASSTLRVYTFDGASWTLDETLSTNRYVANVVSMKSVLLVSLVKADDTAGELVRRETNGTWTTVTGGSSDIGFLGKVVA